MGQYYYVVNLDKKQYLHPHKFDDGLKLCEFGGGGNTMYALALLLADGNGRGSGDNRSGNSLVGSWAGDRIVVAGDYADGEKFLGDLDPVDVAEAAKAANTTTLEVNLHKVAQHCFEDISLKILPALSR